MSHAAPAGPSADRNLLFGILAVQMDFITRDALIAAMNAWVLAKHRPLGELLQEQGALTPPQRQALDLVTAEHLKAHGGDPQRSLAAVGVPETVHRELESVPDAEVHATLATVGGAPAATGTFPPAAAGGTRYRVLRPHARGGLGVVSVARDTELGREVALKEMQAGYAEDAAIRGRFVREAEITGGLEHPGVVPVYGLGRYADGRPYYAMRFVRGETLQEAVKKLHAGEAGYTLRGLLTRFVAVCNAVAYAHSRGVIHRDLKPANVMLGPYGETLVVDWGLAKVVGRPALPDGGGPSEGTLQAGGSGAGEGSATRAGTLMGTPAYMSPEQAAGRTDEQGPATDVYGLGATLYAVLTGRGPIEGCDATEALERVRQGRWEPPRRVRPSAPAALDAICRKAMALRPADRYPSALALAADVERWLADEPVAVYREPWSDRAGRWLKRHRQVVTGAAALLLAAVPLSLVIALNREEARRQAERQREETRAQRDIAEANAKTATEREAETGAVLDLVEKKVFAAARPLGQEGGLGREVTLRQAVEAALPSVEQGFRQQPLIEARLRMTLGTSFRFLGDAQIAADQFQAARTIYAEHLGPDHPATLRSMTNLANSYEELGRHADALTLREETLALQKARLGPDHPHTLVSMNNLGNSYHNLGRDADALRLREETLALQKAKLSPDHPDTLASMNNLANSYHNLGRHTEALRLREETLALRKATLGPDHPDTLTSMNNLGFSYFTLGRHAEAVKVCEEALALRRAKLGPKHPDTLLSMNSLANGYGALGRHAEALQLCEEATALYKAKLGPDHPDTLLSVYNVAENLAALDHSAKEVATLDECFQRAQGKTVDPRLIPAVVDLRLRLFEKAKDAAGCRATAQMWEELHRTDAASLYNAASYRTVTAAVLRAAEKSERAAKEAGAEADRAMAWLKKAVAAGYEDAAHMKKDKDLDALRDREDFNRLLAELEAKVEKGKK